MSEEAAPNNISIQGYVDDVWNKSRLSGWAKWSDSDEPVVVVAHFEDHEVGRVIADGFRADLRSAGRGTGHHAFSLATLPDIPCGALSDGRLKVVACRDGVPLAPLRVTSTVIDQDRLSTQLLAILEILGRLGDDRIGNVARGMGFASGLSPGKAAALLARTAKAASPAELTASRNRSLPVHVSEHLPIAQSVSTILVRAGLVSGDGSCVIGRDGHIFLIAGTNAVEEQYRKDPEAEDVCRLAGLWRDLFVTRQDGFQSRGIQFVQAIIPEKLAVMRSHAPRIVSAQTPLLARIGVLTGNTPGLRDDCLDLRGTFFNRIHPFEPYRKVDLHFTPYGAWLFLQSVVDHLNLEPVPVVQFGPQALSSGDVAARFFDLPLYEVVTLADIQSAQWLAQQPVTSEYTPGTGGHIGRRQSSRNESAPCQKRLLVFGNSFFGITGAASQSTLAWWFARWFREYEFIWSPAVDWAVVDRLKPDIVICQTIERYLDVCPTS